MGLNEVKMRSKEPQKRGGGSGRDALEVEEMIKERERRMDGWVAVPVDLKLYLGIWIMVIQLWQYIREGGQDGPWRGEERANKEIIEGG